MKTKLTLLVLLISSSLFSQNSKLELKIEFINLNQHYKSFAGSFVLLDLKSGDYKIYNDSISKTRYSPCSTFKIANSLIGLESGVAMDENYIIKYDSIKNPSEPWMLEKEPFKYWMQDHTLKTAIKNSVVWYYQEMARRIGKENMTKHLNQMDYGNNDISSGIDNFWLCGSLKVSAREQVDFLNKLYKKQLPGFSSKNVEIVKSIMLYESNRKYKLYGKTGGGDCWENKVVGWFVGFVETDAAKYAFAMNILVDNFNDLADNKRILITKKIIRELIDFYN